MTTYLITWNPRRFHWAELAADVAHVRETGYVEGRWSCGNTRSIQCGDLFFLMRLGQEPRGIMGSGVILSEPFPEQHWEDERARKGESAWFVDLAFETLCDPDVETILAYDTLRHDPMLSSMHWSPQSSGIRIPDEIAAELEHRWFKLLEPSQRPLPEEVALAEGFKEGRTREIVINAHERSPAARQRCIEHYGATCVVCGFNFSEVYGAIGEGYIHVHHIVPLSEIGEEYQVDPIRDMKPVCPNCHAMLHQRRPAYSITEMQEIVTQLRSR